MGKSIIKFITLLIIINTFLITNISAETTDITPIKQLVEEGWVCTQPGQTQEQAQQLLFDTSLNSSACSCNTQVTTLAKYEYSIPSNFERINYKIGFGGDFWQNPGWVQGIKVLCGENKREIFVNTKYYDIYNYRDKYPILINVSIPSTCVENNKLILWQELKLVCAYGGILNVECSGDCNPIIEKSQDGNNIPLFIFVIGLVILVIWVMNKK